MNILSTPLKSALLAVFAVGFAAPSFANELANEVAPQFSVQSNATRSIQSSATAFVKGEYAKSEVYSKRALKEGLKKSRKAAAYSNLCAALGAQGEYQNALTACDAALKIAPQNWQAFSNRAVVNFMAGDTLQAKRDINSAKKIADNSPQILHNMKVFG